LHVNDIRRLVGEEHPSKWVEENIHLVGNMLSYYSEKIGYHIFAFFNLTWIQVSSNIHCLFISWISVKKYQKFKKNPFNYVGYQLFSWDKKNLQKSTLKIY
jgi:hypothetical protein